KRYPLGTPYPDVVADVQRLKALDPLSRKDTMLVADATGVGAPVVDMFARARLEPLSVQITAGAQPLKIDRLHWHVPKRDLASVLQVLLQDDRLRIAARL